MGALLGCSKPSQSDALEASIRLPAGALPSVYQQRVARLASDAVQSPPPEPLEATLRGCIAFCYSVTCEGAPHVRATVFADNPDEHQLNVPVYETLLCSWGEPGFARSQVACKPIRGTDVSDGRIHPSSFWMRSISVGGKKVPFRSLAHWLLHWFLALDDSHPSKQLLVNILLQLHEACFNCVGRHKEVFEYCVYDLMEAEALSITAEETGDAGSRRAVCRHAARFLDRHKRNALHAAFISPLKFLFQHCYEVFENLDSHGASFWAAVLQVYLPTLEMPFERIVDLDNGWGWGAVDFHPSIRSGSAAKAMERFLEPGNLGRDWRSLTAGLQPPKSLPRRIPGMCEGGPAGFAQTLAAVGRKQSTLHRHLRPYVESFASFLLQPVLVRQWTLAALGSETWDAELGPALAALSQEALGTPLSASALREQLCDCASADLEVNIPMSMALLQTAGVQWAQADPL
eukprot:TRINITY_DN22554_c0_g1_i1.p1 TRINITY_DN22554_c0_g1~~TRINITY_DN22554_c0_g1_i1.p1  ORF type:complete len:471 (+),score=83.34 TRINITY_DN22554_c0_g1_i1:36-1415(+)